MFGSVAERILETKRKVVDRMARFKVSAFHREAQALCAGGLEESIDKAGHGERFAGGAHFADKVTEGSVQVEVDHTFGIGRAAEKLHLTRQHLSRLQGLKDAGRIIHI